MTFDHIDLEGLACLASSIFPSASSSVVFPESPGEGFDGVIPIGGECCKVLLCIMSDYWFLHLFPPVAGGRFSNVRQKRHLLLPPFYFFRTVVFGFTLGP